jgi:hypothetical protein
MSSTMVFIGAAPAAVEPLERRVDLVGRGDVGLHPLARSHLHGGDHIGVGGVGHGERELLVVLAQRHGLRVAQELGRDALFQQRQLGVVGRLRERQVELVGERVGEVAPRNHAQAQQDGPDLVARVALLELQRTLEVGAVELAALDQDLTDSLGQFVGIRAVSN